MLDSALCLPQIWSRRARDFIAFSIVVSLVAGVIAIVAGALVSRCAFSTEQHMQCAMRILVLVSCCRHWHAKASHNPAPASHCFAVTCSALTGTSGR